MEAPLQRPAGELPASVEERAAEILLGPEAQIDASFEALCREHEPHRSALLRLRGDFERAARALRPAAPPLAQPPPVIGPYRCVRQIGEGAFGVVYLAEQLDPIRREVAVKLLHTAACSQGAIARFLIERETLARMNHPAIARIFDAGVDAHGRPWFVMEYVPGEPLHRFVATRAAGLEARLELFLGACEGVHHAHQRGVIHRDLKPQNILVAEVDGRWLPKVIDFGLAKVVDGDLDATVHTRAGVVLGTPAYMSPEQVRGDAHEADTRTDVYALGVILYELLTSTLPATADSTRGGLAELRRAILDEQAPLASVRAMQAGIPYARALCFDLDWILRKAMAKQAGERYASVAEFAADLRRHLQHEPVTAGPPTAGYLLRKFVRRHRAAVVAGALVAASLLAGAIVSAFAYRDARDSERRAREHLADFWRLADVVALEELVAAEKKLWPSTPDQIEAHERWLARAQGLVARRALHADTIAALHRRVAAGEFAAGSEAERGASFLLTNLQKHVEALDGFTAAGGALHAVEARAQFARTVHRRSLVDAAPAWQRAIAAVAASADYAGLELEPVVGLVPLGPDHDSGLEEFAVLQSGAVPVRDASGALQLRDDTAIVLVLVPGGTRAIGTQAEHREGARFDPWRTPIENDPTTVTLPAFFVGKYELTQAQVAAFGMPVHALGRAGKAEGDATPFTARHPEESVLAPQVAAQLANVELRLPSIHEWEVIARAGTTSVFGSGDRPADLQGFANVADASLADASPPAVRADRAVRDGFLSHAPVGSFRANAFGLHDTLGNVAELASASSPTGDVLYFACGGSYQRVPTECRVGAMRYLMLNQSSPEVGVRVVRALPRD